MIGEGEFRQSVAETAGDCPFCGEETDVSQVTRTESREYDEEYYGLSCTGCPARYDHDAARWLKPTPPGEEVPTVDVTR